MLHQAKAMVNGMAIRTEPKPHCALCGEKGMTLYVQQKDRLFGAPGLWDLAQCPDRDCGLIWLNPMPLMEDIGTAYLNYYTHAAQPACADSGISFHRQCEWDYVRRRFGYPSPSRNLWARLVGFLVFHREGGSTFVDWKPGGKLLDVGCGAGANLTLMRSFGWEVEGVEFDPEAVKSARQLGLNVRCGVLEQQAYPSESFDVVTLHHVIEHVPDPVATLVECARILRPGGKVLIATPSSSSLTRKIFKQNWRGWEPPRHLHIFSPASATRTLALAGFKDIVIRPQAAKSAIYESIQLQRGFNPYELGEPKPRFLSFLARSGALVEGIMSRFNPLLADCLVGIGTK